jgi:hypothetical protein
MCYFLGCNYCDLRLWRSTASRSVLESAHAKWDELVNMAKRSIGFYMPTLVAFSCAGLVLNPQKDEKQL